MSRRSAVVLVLALGLCLPAPGTAESPGQSFTKITPNLMLQGSDSRIERHEVHLVRDAKKWTELWKRHRSGEPAPRLDFAKSAALAVFQGKSWNSHGLRADIHRLSKSIRVRYDDLSFQTSGPDGGGVRCSAYGIWVFDRQGLPVIVEENVQGYIGQAPVWKRRATFDPNGLRLKG